MKRTVPREDVDVTGVFKTKKIFVGGIAQFFTDGIANPPPLFFFGYIRICVFCLLTNGFCTL